MYILSSLMLNILFFTQSDLFMCYNVMLDRLVKILCLCIISLVYLNKAIVMYH